MYNVTLHKLVHSSWTKESGYTGPKVLLLPIEMPFAPFPQLTIEHNEVCCIIQDIAWYTNSNEFTCDAGTFSGDDLEYLQSIGWLTYEQFHDRKNKS